VPGPVRVAPPRDRAAPAAEGRRRPEAGGEDVPKLIPVPDELSKPFWDACNERRLVVQHCKACNTLQFPPRPACRDCGSNELDWQDTDGKGHIMGYLCVEDGRIKRMQPDQPYNIAVITLDQEPRINFYSNLPGLPPKQVPVGAAVEVYFEEVGPGQLIHEFRLVQ
jgi:uncharacterized OB-fold protein